MFKRKRNIENEVNWLSDKVQYVDLVELENYSELNFLKPLLSEKKLVLLGENGHGVKEHTQIKSKLIKYLYQELGFKVLAFESSLGDCSFSSQQQMNMNAEQLIKQSLFKVWHTEEMLDLFAWIKDTQSCQSPLTFTGIDIQPSSKESITSKTLCSIFSHIEEAYGNEIMDLEKKMLDEYVNSYNTTSKKEKKIKCKDMQKRYKSFSLLLEENHTRLQEYFDRKSLLLAKRVLQNRDTLLEMISSNFMKSIKIRNKAMADNIVWLIKEIYKGEKVIIWAHNSHIAKKMQGLIGFKSTFSYVPSEIKRNSYSIGLFMHTGSAAENNRSIYEVQNPEKDSIEFRMQKIGYDVSFLDISNQYKVSENNWLFKYTYTMNEGKDISLIKPSACYDGLITCSKTRPPNYLSL